MYCTQTVDEFATKDEMINRILFGDQYTDSDKHPKLILRQQEAQQAEDALIVCLDNFREDLRQIF